MLKIFGNNIVCPQLVQYFFAISVRTLRTARGKTTCSRQITMDFLLVPVVCASKFLRPVRELLIFLSQLVKIFQVFRSVHSFHANFKCHCRDFSVEIPHAVGFGEVIRFRAIKFEQSSM